jgi:hypothetical protein
MFVENTAAFFTDFGQTATVGGVSVSGIFDKGYALGSVGAMGMASSQPTLTLATASVPASPVGTAVVVGGGNYLVGAHEPDGTGMSRLLLEAA